MDGGVRGGDEEMGMAWIWWPAGGRNLAGNGERRQYFNRGGG
ncbi:hypothetical protein Tco_1534723, partial [Tanacetum coccineum]